MKPILSLLLLCLGLAAAPLRAAAQTASSLWSYQLSYHNATQAISVGNEVYALFNGNLLRHSTYDQSVETLDKLSPGLSDKEVSRMGYSDTEQCLVLFYANRNVDLVYGDGTVVNLPQLKNFADYTITATNLNVHGRWATISTTEGIVVIDLQRQEIRSAYRFGQNVADAIVLDGTLYAALSSRVISGELTDNLYDLSQWQTYRDGLTATQFVGQGDNAYLLVPYIAGQTDAYSGLCYLGAPDALGTRQLTRVTEIVFSTGTRNGNNFLFSGSANLVEVNAATPTELQFRIYTGLFPLSAVRTVDGTIFQAEAEQGLVGYTLGSDRGSIAPNGEVIGNFGPRRDLGYDLTLADGTLYMAGGQPDYQDGRHTGFLARCLDGEWDDMDETAAAAAAPQYVNMLAPSVDPADRGHVFATSYGIGLFEYQDGKFQRLYTPDNSALVSAVEGSNRYIRLGGSAYDDEGNLWIANNHADSGLVVLRNDGSWNRVYVSSLADQQMMDKVRFDSRGYLWINMSANTGRNSGALFGLDYGGTITRFNDDRSQLRSSATNEDGTACDFGEVQDLVEDREGQIWFGSTTGVYAVTDAEAWFSNDFTLYQPKVPRNDGTNYADYLLTGITVRSLAVDGGNRKWLGTLGAGLYLVSPDGSEVLEHFTEADSPLLSDNVLALRLDPSTGVLYISTDRGLCTYRTDVTEPQASLAKNNVRVSPNPVRPEYNGRITISGLTEGAEVKIVSTGSELVARGNATGGTFIWDGRSTAAGKRVAPGVYYVLVSTADGKQSVAAKLVVI